MLDLVAPHVTAVLCGAAAIAWALSVPSAEGAATSRATASRTLSEYGKGVCDSYLDTHHPVRAHYVLWV